MKVALFLLLSGLALVVEGEVFKNTVSVCPKGAKFCCPGACAALAAEQAGSRLGSRSIRLRAPRFSRVD